VSLSLSFSIQQAAAPQQQQHPWLRYRGNGQFQQQQQANFAPGMGQFFMPMAGPFPHQMAAGGGGFQPPGVAAPGAGMMPPAGAGPGFMGGAYPPPPQGQFYPQQLYHPFNQQQMAQYWGYYNQFGR
jgi:hypothetical protein